MSLWDCTHNTGSAAHDLRSYWSSVSRNIPMGFSAYRWPLTPVCRPQQASIVGAPVCKQVIKGGESALKEESYIDRPRAIRIRKNLRPMFTFPRLGVSNGIHYHYHLLFSSWPGQSRARARAQEGKRHADNLQLQPHVQLSPPARPPARLSVPPNRLLAPSLHPSLPHLL